MTVLPTRRLGDPDVASLTMGQSPPSSTYISKPSGFPFYQGKADFGLRRPTPRIWCTAPLRFADAGDTLISVRAPVGAVNQAGEQCALGRGLAGIRAGRAMHPDFLYFALLWARPLIESQSTGTTFESINRSVLDNLDIPAPGLSDQVAMGSLLSAVDYALASEHKALSLLAELKRATMAHLFTHGTRGEALKETEIGAVPESWGVVPMSRVLTQAQYGLSLRGQRAGAYPILRMNCQLDGKTIFRDLQFVDLEVRVYDSFRLHDGNLLFNRTNSYELVGRTSLVEGERPAVFASYLIRLGIDRGQISPRFLNYYLGLVSTQVALKSIASRGVSQANISASKLRDFLIPLPPTLDGQEEIVARILAIDECIEVNTAKLNRLQELFQSLLDGLMTGALSVPALSELPQIEVAGVS